MIKSQFKIKILKKVDELKSFLILPVLLLISVTTISIHDTYKNDQLKNLENLIRNIYLQKTLESISDNLKPRFEKIEYIINSGDTFEGILSEIKLHKDEKKKNFRVYIKKKNKS